MVVYALSLQVGLHACGVATDMVMERCIQAGAAFVVSPCCYGFIQNAVKFTFPKRFVPGDGRLTSPGLWRRRSQLASLLRVFVSPPSSFHLPSPPVTFTLLTVSHTSAQSTVCFVTTFCSPPVSHHHRWHDEAAASCRLHSRVRLTPPKSQPCSVSGRADDWLCRSCHGYRRNRKAPASVVLHYHALWYGKLKASFTVLFEQTNIREREEERTVVLV